MLWAISVTLIILWMLGMGADYVDYAMGPFIHILYAAAVIVLVVSIDREVMMERKMRRTLRSRGCKPDR